MATTVLDLERFWSKVCKVERMRGYRARNKES